MTNTALRTVALGRIYKVKAGKAGTDDEPAPSSFTALDNVNVEVHSGELFGLLGSNGAGKTTLIKILTTLLAPSSGAAWVDGLDVVSQAKRIRERINMVSGGETSGYGILTTRENLWLFSQLYGVPRKVARERIDGLLNAMGLAEKADTRISHLSTGLRQKMNFCRGFVTDPKILFLDEPTLGLDVHAARTVRRFVREWMYEKPGRTVVLTTHYMAEADELCDRVAIMHRGKVITCDSPRALKQRVQRYPIFELALAASEVNGWRGVSDLPGVRQFTSVERNNAIDIKVALEEEAVVGTVVQQVIGGGSRILSLKKVEPTLEDVFVEFVGQGLRPEVDR